VFNERLEKRTFVPGYGVEIETTIHRFVIEIHLVNISTKSSLLNKATGELMDHNCSSYYGNVTVVMNSIFTQVIRDSWNSP
jgi:hypothetical protein